MKEILNHSERLTRAEIQKIPDGTYSYTDYCDGDGVIDEPIKIQVALTVKGSNVVVDFTGSHGQVIGGMNAPLAVTTSSVQFAVKAATDHWNPTNSGCYRPVKIVAPEGTVVNPRLPASVVAANHETAMTIVAAVFGALDQASKANPERVIAAGSGSSIPIVFGGSDSRLSKKGRYYVFHFVQGGAWGARYDKDGISALRDGVGNTGNTPVEVVETEYPIMFESYELVPDGGGPGKFRGGLPAKSIFKTLVDSTLTITAERGRFAPYGLRGGKSAVKARFILNPGTDKEKILFSKVGPLGLKAGDVLLAHSAGGGGFGNPMERDPSLVRRDVIDGYVSLRSAEEDYGVILNPETFEIVRLKRDQ
jgi:N-methylhydantoinase B